MFDAQLLFNGSTVFSPWFPRRKNNVRVTLDVVAVNAAQIKIELFTKKSEDSGFGAVSGSTNITTSTTGRTTTEWLNDTTTDALNDLVRYKFTVTGKAGEWVLFRMLPMVWFDKVS